MKKYIGMAALAALVACSEDDKPQNQDTAAPSIHHVEINGSEEFTTVSAGADMTLEAEIEDNEDLQELKLEIHDIFDGHAHGKKASSWEQVIILPLSGTTQNISENIMVPGAATAGMYHVVLRALDASGNESDFVEKEFAVSNGNEPQIAVTNPTFGQSEVHALKGQKFDLQGTITEDSDMVEIRIMIAKEEHTGQSHKKSSETIFMADIDLDGSNDTSYDLSQVEINIPSDAETGHYQFSIIAKDSAGNYGVFMEEIHVM